MVLLLTRCKSSAAELQNLYGSRSPRGGQWASKFHAWPYERTHVRSGTRSRKLCRSVLAKEAAFPFLYLLTSSKEDWVWSYVGQWLVYGRSDYHRPALKALFIDLQWFRVVIAALGAALSKINITGLLFARSRELLWPNRGTGFRETFPFSSSCPR